MRKILLLIAILTNLTSWGYTVDRIPNVHLENRSRYVSNPDGILSPETQSMADSILSGIWAKTSSEVVAVVVNEIEPADIDAFATELFTSWGIGKKDNNNGLLVLIVKDMRRATIRTGYGMEGIIPDIIAGHIIRDNMAPHFRKGDYDSGTLEALSRLSEIITTPGAADELMSKYRNDANAGKGSNADPFTMFLIFIAVMTVCLTAYFIATLWRTRHLDRFDRYRELDKLSSTFLLASFLGLGIPVLLYLLQRHILKRLRNKPRECPNCNHKMTKLDETHDNEYLTPAQDTEERINSIDYDVWLCPQCGETDILPYIVKTSGYTVCPQCGARACSLKSDRIIRNATHLREGQGVKEFVCNNCHNISHVTYLLPKLAAPVVIVGGGRGFGGGGGFSGGSFGGGFTGGGGASGGW
ncbi:MAG: TPM domain-containing protein [Muribaculaceae bacterium]|nr:TPM domain-containing protein [Muribaculaceae bacterium]